MTETETNLTKRWEQDLPHHPESIKLMDAMKVIDKANGYAAGDMTDTGGDGDLGELLMFLMDIAFEQRGDVVTLTTAEHTELLEYKAMYEGLCK